MRTLFLSAFLVLGSLLSTSCGDDEEDTSAVTLTSQITGNKFKINSVEFVATEHLFYDNEGDLIRRVDVADYQYNEIGQWGLNSVLDYKTTGVLDIDYQTVDRDGMFPFELMADHTDYQYHVDEPVAKINSSTVADEGTLIYNVEQYDVAIQNNVMSFKIYGGDMDWSYTSNDGTTKSIGGYYKYTAVKL